MKRHNPRSFRNPGPGSARGAQPWASLPVWALLLLLVPGPGPAASEADPETPVPVVKTVEMPENPVSTPPVRATPPRVAAPAEGRSKGPRTLDEINIEGEIAVPQVLFITARDRRRYRDLLHRRYLEESTEMGRELALPARLGCILGS